MILGSTTVKDILKLITGIGLGTSLLPNNIETLS